jgi:hypothetical protein
MEAVSDGQLVIEETMSYLHAFFTPTQFRYLCH